VAVPSTMPPARRSRLNNPRMVDITSGRRSCFEQTPTTQQRVRLRLAATERDIGFLGLARAARRIDIVMQSPGSGGIEDVAGLLEGAEGVGVQHVRPHV